ncbi:unnamed protein product, partial [Amoebophrya sp. A120]|eukprot:GSA120T00003934001.1
MMENLRHGNPNRPREHGSVAMGEDATSRPPRPQSTMHSVIPNERDVDDLRSFLDSIATKYEEGTETLAAEGVTRGMIDLSRELVMESPFVVALSAWLDTLVWQIQHVVEAEVVAEVAGRAERGVDQVDSETKKQRNRHARKALEEQFKRDLNDVISTSPAHDDQAAATGYGILQGYRARTSDSALRRLREWALCEDSSLALQEQDWFFEILASQLIGKLKQKIRRVAAARRQMLNGNGSIASVRGVFASQLVKLVPRVKVAVVADNRRWLYDLPPEEFSDLSPSMELAITFSAVELDSSGISGSSVGGAQLLQQHEERRGADRPHTAGRFLFTTRTRSAEEQEQDRLEHRMVGNQGRHAEEEQDDINILYGRQGNYAGSLVLQFGLMFEAPLPPTNQRVDQSSGKGDAQHKQLPGRRAASGPAPHRQQPKDHREQSRSCASVSDQKEEAAWCEAEAPTSSSRFDLALTKMSINLPDMSPKKVMAKLRRLGDASATTGSRGEDFRSEHRLAQRIQSSLQTAGQCCFYSASTAPGTTSLSSRSNSSSSASASPA